MTDSAPDKYSAGEQGLGYIYQPRLALLRLLELPENTAVFLEKDDDLDFVDKDGSKSLASLKHKAAGERLTDLSTDFWKSVRIWLTRYKRDGCSECLKTYSCGQLAPIPEPPDAVCVSIRHDHLREANDSIQSHPERP